MTLNYITKKGDHPSNVCGLTLQDLDYSPFAGAVILNLETYKNKGDQYSLATLAECLLEESVQQGGVQHHNAVEDARTTMELYLYDEGPWEASLDLGDAD